MYVLVSCDLIERTHSTDDIAINRSERTATLRQRSCISYVTDNYSVLNILIFNGSFAWFRVILKIIGEQTLKDYRLPTVVVLRGVAAFTLVRD